jgi:hypothetical protein
VPPLQNKYLAFNAFWELGEKLELGFMALLGESFSVINEPAQQALSYYTIHEFWAHVPLRHFCSWKWAYLSHHYT